MLFSRAGLQDHSGNTTARYHVNPPGAVGIVAAKVKLRPGVVSAYVFGVGVTTP